MTKTYPTPLTTPPSAFDRNWYGALHSQYNETIEGRYGRGFIDAYFDRPYNDGIHPPHYITVFIPIADPYRDGWNAGKLAQAIDSN